MTYFKSVLVGLLATVIAIILWFLVVVNFVVKPALKAATAALRAPHGSALFRLTVGLLHALRPVLQDIVVLT